MSPEFFQTGMGQKFFEGDFPQLIQTLKQLHQDNLKLIDCKEHELTLKAEELKLKERELRLLEQQ